MRVHVCECVVRVACVVDPCMATLMECLQRAIRLRLASTCVVTGMSNPRAALTSYPTEALIGHTSCPKISHPASIKRALELTTPGPASPAQDIDWDDKAAHYIAAVANRSVGKARAKENGVGLSRTSRNYIQKHVENKHRSIICSDQIDT